MANNEKILNSRLQQKHDIEANWIKATNFRPKPGEIIIYDADENCSYPRVKIGNEAEDLVNDLPFLPSGGNGGIYIGSGEMPEGYNIQIDPNGDTLEAEDIYGHIEDKNNPHEVTAEQIGAVPQEEIGNKQEIYKLDIEKATDRYYYNTDRDMIEQEDCAIYSYHTDSNDCLTAGGITMRIKTYIYEDMAVILNDEDVYSNNGANIEQNPESGLFEFEITIPSGGYESNLSISFCKNPYIDKPIVYIPQNTIWDEIKKLQKGTIWETFGAGYGCYRKSEEITEFFGTGEIEMIFTENGYGYGYMELPDSIQNQWVDVYSIVHINEANYSYGLPNPIQGILTDSGEIGWCLQVYSKIDDVSGETVELNVPIQIFINFSIIVPNKPPR